MKGLEGARASTPEVRNSQAGFAALGSGFILVWSVGLHGVLWGKVFMIWALGFMVWGLAFTYCPALVVWGLGFAVHGGFCLAILGRLSLVGFTHLKVGAPDVLCSLSVA